MIAFKRTISLPCFGLLNYFVLLQAFLAQPLETWATENVAVGVGKHLGSALVMDVLCNWVKSLNASR